MPITCHRCRRIWWSQPMGNMPAARLPHSMVHWFQTSGSRGDDGTSHFGSRNVPQLWVGFDPCFTFVHQHWWIFSRSSLTFWCLCHSVIWKSTNDSCAQSNLKTAKGSPTLPCADWWAAQTELQSFWLWPPTYSTLESLTSSTQTWRWFFFQKNSKSHDPTETYS